MSVYCQERKTTFKLTRLLYLQTLSVSAGELFNECNSKHLLEYKSEVLFTFTAPNFLLRFCDGLILIFQISYVKHVIRL